MLFRSVYHSALSDGERYDTWRYLLNKEPQVVIGTRSAVFAPLPNLGVIILDEEHDSGYKQEQPAPCYHARMVAGWRSQLSDCPLILGSATPSLETYTLHYPTLPSPCPGEDTSFPVSPLTKGGLRGVMQGVLKNQTCMYTVVCEGGLP